jgi:hypothetical protein
MTYLSKKILISSIAGILLIIGVIASALGYTYYRAVTGKGEVSVPQFSLNPSSEIKLGDVIKLRTVVKCPWGRYPDKAELKVPEGVQVVTEPEIKRVGTSWGKSTWEILAELQPFRVGEIKKSDCSVVIISEKDGKTVSSSIKGEVPGFKVLAVDTKNDRALDVASEARERYMIEKSNLMFLLVVLILLIGLAGTVAAIIIWVNKRKRMLAEVSLNPWQLALSLLEELRQQMKSQKIKGQVCVSRLSDIVRNYLEQRFDIHAPTQTTQEFLIDLDKSFSPLETDHKQFLRDFMTAADMVKFAKLPADDGLLENALNKAEQLVESTAPDENSKEFKTGAGND